MAKCREQCPFQTDWHHIFASIHSDISLAQLTVMCRDFSLLGVETSKGGAEMFILNSTLQSARTSGILDFANRQRLWPKDLLDQESIEAFVFLGKHRHQAPRAFHLLKWKTSEHLADWRWRLAVSHKFHPLQRTSRLIGRCLSLLLREFHIAFPHFPCFVLLRVVLPAHEMGT